MDKGNFIQEVERRLGAEFPTLAEASTRAVLKTLHRRLEPGQAGHVATHLPVGLKEYWRVEPADRIPELMRDGVEDLNKHRFLEAVKEEAHFHNTDEAYLATRAVFGALKLILPPKDAADTGGELPEDLREIWAEAA